MRAASLGQEVLGEPASVSDSVLAASVGGHVAVHREAPELRRFRALCTSGAIHDPRGRADGLVASCLVPLGDRGDRLDGGRRGWGVAAGVERCGMGFATTRNYPWVRASAFSICGTYAAVDDPVDRAQLRVLSGLGDAVPGRGA